jgi:catechol 2,3-dioxygenase-like lactoylglutathione lyase family enzyme
MRLRQVALASRGLDGAVQAFNDVFGLKVAYNDPHIDSYGLRNAVLSAGTGFLEVVEPIREDASAARFLNRRGGDAGYMVIIQVADAEAERARVAGLGVRVVDDIDTRAYRCAHFHPADFGGMLTSFDQQRTEPDFREPYGDWMPAGPDWRAARTAEVRDLTAVTLTASDPQALAKRWSELTGRRLDPDDPLRLPLDKGEVRFRAGDPGGATSICELELAMADPQLALERARAAGLDVTADGVLIGGVRFRPVLAQVA